MIIAQSSAVQNMPISLKMSQERGSKIAQGLRNHKVIHKTANNNNNHNATNNINININIITTGNPAGIISNVTQSAENLIFAATGNGDVGTMNQGQFVGGEGTKKFRNVRNIDGKVPYLVSPQSTKSKASKSLVPHTLREEQRQSLVNV